MIILVNHLKYQSIDRLLYAGLIHSSITAESSEGPDICLAESGKASRCILGGCDLTTQLMAVGNHQKAMELQSEKSWIFRRETMRWLYPEVDRVIFPWKGAIKSPCETQVNHRQIISKSMGRSAIEKKKNVIKASEASPCRLSPHLKSEWCWWIISNTQHQ